MLPKCFIEGLVRKGCGLVHKLTTSRLRMVCGDTLVGCRTKTIDETEIRKRYIAETNINKR
jgi:hypothetical protein